MGTTYTVKYLPPAPVVRSMAPIAASAALDAVVAAMSTYETSSEISLFNRLPAETDFPASPEFFQVLELAGSVQAATQGAFDPTVRPLVKAFGFGSGASDEPPSSEELEALRKKIGWSLLSLSEGKRSISKKVDGLELDLGGIAKGYGVDQVALALEKLKVESYMVEVGGEIRTRGKKPNGEGWKLAIEEPIAGQRKLHATLTLPESGAALATSGDYRNFRQHEGEVVSHTFDPRSGSPVPRRTASVSVIRPTAAEADALATALSVLSPEESIKLADEQGWALYLLLHDREQGFTAKSSKAFNSVDWQRVSPP